MGARGVGGLYIQLWVLVSVRLRESSNSRDLLKQDLGICGEGENRRHIGKRRNGERTGRIGLVHREHRLLFDG